MTARFMRQDFFDFDPQLTLMVAGNTQPSFQGIDEAIRARVVLVPFTVTIPADRRDQRLPAKLKDEAPAILRWCIDGALAWQKRGLCVPASLTDASKAYFYEEDMLGQFLDEATSPDPHCFESSDDLYQRFAFWCGQQGVIAWEKRTFIKELKSRGYKDAKSGGKRGLKGLRLGV
jgi:putative DNA primase/helicase